MHLRTRLTPDTRTHGRGAGGDRPAPRPQRSEHARAAALRGRAFSARAASQYARRRARRTELCRIAVRRVNLGDVANPGLPLIEIEGDGGLELKATVDSAAATRLRPGSKLKAVVDGLDGPLAATVSAIAPAGDPTTHRFELKADLPAAPGLRSGLFARLLVPGVGSDPRISVPAEALFHRGGLTGVYVVDGGRARLRWVAAGAREGGSVEIRAGLEPAERVVLRPADLVDGNPVRVVRQTAREEEAR